jgi:hypothetical protein
MPLFFFIIGFVLIDSGFRGNAKALYSQFASDAKGFAALFAVIAILGACGFSSALRPVAKGLLFLVFVVFFVRNGNQIVSGLEIAVSSSATSSPANSTPSSSASVPQGQGVANTVSSAANGVAGGANSVSGMANTISNAINSIENFANIF